MKAIPRDKIPDAIAVLRRKYKIVAPVGKGGGWSFSVVEGPQTVQIDYTTTILPLKKFFLPTNEAMLKYNIATQEAREEEHKTEPTLFFGIHNYEMQGLLRLDHAFLSGVKDPAYLSRREKCAFVGVSYQPDEFHFADSVGIPSSLKEGFDVFLTRCDDCYRLEALTKAGAAIEADLASLLVERELPADAVVFFKNKLKQSVAGIREVFHGAYANPVWTETAKKCLSCGTCNIVCPTCYCFDVDDNTALGSTHGERLRLWDSCQFTSFTTVAGGEAFREKRTDRVRHRMSRKFAFVSDDKGRPFCVGCGRCVRQCAAKISITDVMNALL